MRDAQLERAFDDPTRIIAIDEVGKMELLSRRFAPLLTDVRGAPNPLLATVVQQRYPSQMRSARLRVEPYEVSAANRDLLPAALAKRLARNER